MAFSGLMVAICRGMFPSTMIARYCVNRLVCLSSLVVSSLSVELWGAFTGFHSFRSLTLCTAASEASNIFIILSRMRASMDKLFFASVHLQCHTRPSCSISPRACGGLSLETILFHALRSIALSVPAAVTSLAAKYIQCRVSFRGGGAFSPPPPLELADM